MSMKQGIAINNKVLLGSKDAFLSAGNVIRVFKKTSTEYR